MNVLILGSGGREHALAWKIGQSKACDLLYVAPGNGGTASFATNVAIGVNEFDKIKAFLLEKAIDLLVVGPEEPLVKGIVNELKGDAELAGVRIVGPDSQGARLEGSKDFAKEFMHRHKIPTAGAQVFDQASLEEGKKYLETLKAPYVLKADGLAAGKGVIITEDLDEARHQLEELIRGRFGEASARVLVEEFLSGIELSVFVLTDGEHYQILPEAKDYKRIGEGDTGPNTGGMGAVSPVPFADPDFMRKVEDRVVKPTIDGIRKEGFDYKGFIFLGLINVDNEPYVIEYNVRMGDPETQVVMPRIKSDLLPLLVACADGRLHETTIQLEEKVATTVVLVSGGYPGNYEKGKKMELGGNLSNVIPFHAGTRLEGGNLLTSGGRVMAITGMAETMDAALQNSYTAIEGIHWEGMTFRKDIGADLKGMDG